MVSRDICFDYEKSILMMYKYYRIWNTTTILGYVAGAVTHNVLSASGNEDMEN